MRISDWSSDVCSSDLSVEITTRLQTVRTESGRRQHDAIALIEDAPRFVVQIENAAIDAETDDAKRHAVDGAGQQLPFALQRFLAHRLTQRAFPMWQHEAHQRTFVFPDWWRAVRPRDA